MVQTPPPSPAALPATAGRTIIVSAIPDIFCQGLWQTLLMRASRLLSLLLLLQTRGRLTARELADEAGVSVRTVYRDIDALSAAGIPVFSEPGPAGGFELVDGFRTRLTGLTPGEASAIFLAGMPGPAAELGLGALLATAELKVMAALPPGLRESATLVRERFQLDAPGWFRDGDQPQHLADVAAAVWDQRPLRVVYQGREGAGWRAIDPLGLVLKAGVWYVVAQGDSGLRTYRVSRIEDLEVISGTFQRPPDFDLEGYWRSASDAFMTRLYSGRVLARLSPRGLALLPHVVDTWVASTVLASAAAPGPDAWVQVEIPVESDDIALTQLLQFGPELEVLAPEGLRRRIAEAARNTAAIYQTSGPDQE
jgi:predicted DNA-binding transcriptional regulator YafY